MKQLVDYLTEGLKFKYANNEIANDYCLAVEYSGLANENEINPRSIYYQIVKALCKGYFETDKTAYLCTLENVDKVFNFKENKITDSMFKKLLNGMEKKNLNIAFNTNEEGKKSDIAKRKHLQ